MSGPAGFLEFFILEAADYVEQLDGVLLRGGASGPDGDALQRAARALRGTATMAKLPSFAEVASSIERVGRAMQDGALRWDPALGGALVAAVDDLKILLRNARSWSPSEDERASARASELSRYAPSRAVAQPAAPTIQPAVAGANVYFATEASNIAAGLELLTTRAGDPDTAANVLRRVRALRGVAGVKEIGPLADVLEATENAARGLESGREQISAEARQLLEAAASYLRSLASALRGDGGGDIHAPSSSRDAFNAALDSWATQSGERERVVPIADLFYGDGAPGVLEASQNPPTSAAERFRLELVSLGEHLRQVVDGARRATDNASTVRARRELRSTLRALQAAAQSFGEIEVAALVGEHIESANHVDFLGLAALDDLAAVVADPGTGSERLRARLQELTHGRSFTSSIGAGFGSGDAPEASPAARATPTRPSGVSPLRVETPVYSQAIHGSPPSAPAALPTPPMATPVVALDSGSAALIDSGIAALESLGDVRFVEPAEIPEDVVVPIESLLYRGRAALDRAVEIRDELKRGGVQRDPAALEELFDLLELARAE
jgi:HPt (histidine-containing phosphotransfer) domain-containing protein